MLFALFIHDFSSFRTILSKKYFIFESLISSYILTTMLVGFLLEKVQKEKKEKKKEKKPWLNNKLMK